MRARWLLLCALAMAAGCSSDIGNRRAQAPPPADPVRWRAAADCMATESVRPDDSREALARRCLAARPERERDFVAVALSGGGTKAAVFSAETMFYLEALGLMRRASVLSSVSGGSFAAALYALSCDPDGVDAEGRPACLREGGVRGLRRPVWRHGEVMRTVGQGYRPLVAEQVGRFLVPAARGTIDAGGFARFIDRRFLGTSSGGGARFLFADLNPRRPHLVLNATILSPNRGGLGSSSASVPACNLDPTRPRGWLRRRNPDEFFHFAYTDVYFGLLGSDLGGFPVSGAVAASAAFPVLIDQATLVDHCRDEADKDRHLLLMDGGANDNQGMVEIYHMLAEMVLGQRRSAVPTPGLERLKPGDAAFVFVVNASVTDTTGPTGSGTGSGPVGAVGWLSEVVGKTLNSVDVYSATAFNLRKNFYVSEARRVEALPRPRGAPRRPTIWPVEIGLTGLDQYRSGGAQAALWKKSGLLDNPEPGERTDPTLEELQRRERLQREVLKRVVPAASRGRLRLSDHHPQCYFDIRDRLDASLVSLGADEQACLREAARWSTALVAQGLCVATEGGGDLRPPDGLDCGAGLVSLKNPGVLGEGNDVGGSCEAILGPLIERQRRDREQQAQRMGRPAPAPGEDDCRRLPPG